MAARSNSSTPDNSLIGGDQAGQRELVLGQHAVDGRSLQQLHAGQLAQLRFRHRQHLEQHFAFFGADEGDADRAAFLFFIPPPRRHGSGEEE
jgi:hypothetical protein